MVSIETRQRGAHHKDEVARCCLLLHVLEQVVTQAAAVFYNRVAWVEPASVNFIDVFLAIARFLRQTVVVLLNPCMQQVSAVESGQHKMCECWKRIDAGSAIGFALGTGSRLRDACCGVSDTSTVGSE